MKILNDFKWDFSFCKAIREKETISFISLAAINECKDFSF